MDQLTVVGRRGIARDLLVALQSLGVVQVDPLEPGEDLPLTRVKLRDGDLEQKEGWDRAVARSESLIDALRVGGVKAAGRSEVPTGLDALHEQLETIGTQVDQLVAERGEIRDELDVVATYLPMFRDLAPLLAQLENSRYLDGAAFTVPADRFEDTTTLIADALDERVLFTSRDRGRDLLVVAAILKRDRSAFQAALGRAGLAELVLPERYSRLGVAKAVHVMEERSQALPKRRDLIEKELAELAGANGARLQAINTVARNHQARLERLGDLAEGRYGFALRGWVPSLDRSRVVDGLKKQFGDDIVIEARPADEHVDHDVPIKLDNPGWIKPFEGLLSLFAPPKYGSFDPSWTLAVFFPFFFGLVVGDIGFGLMFAALAWWLRRRGGRGRNLDLGPLGIVIPAAALLPITTVIFWCAGWSVAWGIVYGEFFGNFLEHWPHDRPVFYPGDKGIFPILLFRVEQFTPLLLISLGFGILQVLGGWLIRVIYGLRHGDMKHVWEGVGMFSGLVAIVIFATAFMTGNLNPVVNTLVILGFVIFLVAVVLARMPLMLVEIVSNSGNILSYLRLFAVGLSAALVANLATDLGFALGGTLPIIGPIIGIVVALAVHLIAIALTIIGHTLQPLRLHYVEFFTKFGYYDENGRPYQPFRLLGGKS